MPLLRQQDWPSLDRVAQQGARVIDQIPSDTPSLHIGLLNMMPDRALAATERQFLHLLDSHDTCVCVVHRFCIDGVPRETEGHAYLQQHYQDCSAIAQTELDALIITGANVTQPHLAQEPFWDALETVLRQSDQRLLPVVCSCLAAHASAQIFHDIKRRHLPAKRWGIFTHEVRAPHHPLTAGLPQSFEMPHSRFNDISEQELCAHDVEVLITGPEAGVQMAVEPDGRRIYFQGHPEYEAISLLKEYKREVWRYLSDERPDYPPVPEHAFSDHALQSAQSFQQWAQSQARSETLIEKFPEAEMTGDMRHSWKQVSRQLFNNWLEHLRS